MDVMYEYFITWWQVLTTKHGLWTQKWTKLNLCTTSETLYKQLILTRVTLQTFFSFDKVDFFQVIVINLTVLKQAQRWCLKKFWDFYEEDTVIEISKSHSEQYEPSGLLETFPRTCSYLYTLNIKMSRLSLVLWGCRGNTTRTHGEKGFYADLK